MIQRISLAVLLALSLASVSFGDEPASSEEGYVCPPCMCPQDGKIFASAGTCPGCGMALVPRSDIRSVAVLVFPGVELLDFAGPAEVFTAAHVFRVYTVSADGKPVVSQGFLTVDPEFGIDDVPPPDILIVPGGGVVHVLENPRLMAWIKSTAGTADHVLSVCNGAFVLAEAGLLDGLRATTHTASLDRLREDAPRTEVLEGRRFVDNGKIVTSGGVSAGIDMALHVVARLLGEDEAARTARYMEYAWKPGE